MLVVMLTSAASMPAMALAAGSAAASAMEVRVVLERGVQQALFGRLPLRLLAATWTAEQPCHKTSICPIPISQ